ncbi:C40 family peptidase [Pseudomonas veronii]|uniref:C40 family peptidase n=1 Tax=Pseudomonas veronii TaxID=76761 RepID=A0A4P7Y2N5_PSEVE|nr:C40 family peptidase [Pseudomonas veronii]QCG64941.1 C40 family peptidase [Pseudomonas veronii]
MFKSLFFLILFSLSCVISSASANLKPQSTFGSSLPGVPTSSVANVVDRAHALLGTPYKWGGTSAEQGFDCSSFLVYLFKTEANIHIPRTTAAMHRSTAATVKRNESLKPGDAVFFKGNGRGQVSHVGLYIGEGKFIHSPRAGKNVRIDSLSNNYWNKNYTGAKRFHTAG